MSLGSLPLWSLALTNNYHLASPRVLNLPSHDEITAIEHLELLRLNGYDVLVDEDADVGERVKLLAQPVSNKTVFDIAGERNFLLSFCQSL